MLSPARARARVYRSSARSEDTLHLGDVPGHQQDLLERRSGDPRNFGPVLHGERRDTPLVRKSRVDRVGRELISEDPLRPRVEYIVGPGLAATLPEGHSQIGC